MALLAKINTVGALWVVNRIVVGNEQGSRETDRVSEDIKAELVGSVHCTG